MANKIALKEESVRIVDWKVWYSEKKKLDYAMLEIKKDSWFKELIYIENPTEPQKELIKNLDENMWGRITVVTSVVVD